jgi:hypothetical protein
MNELIKKKCDANLIDKIKSIRENVIMSEYKKFLESNLLINFF